MTQGYESPWAEDLENFLAFKHARGNPYRRAEFVLHSFDRYAVTHPDQRLEDTFLGWLASRGERKPVSVTNEVGVIRQFCTFLRRRDPECFIPPRTWAPQDTKSHFLPHIFSDEEVRALLRLASSLPGPKIRPVAIRMLLLVLYCTGLRIGEAVRLSLSEVDLNDHTFAIAPSKGRSRIVPFGSDLAQELASMLRVRADHAGDAPSAALFVRADGKALSVRNASDTIRTLLQRAGLKPAKGRTGPRPYDLRHTFAVHRLTRWYREGKDINAMLPWLSAYMGHYDIFGTEAYLNATPELLQLVGERFEHHFSP